jgi:prepilin-type N-terminal cleavage/methylation domain-containing protein
MRRGARQSNRGFTLAELIIAMSLGLVVMLAVFSTYLYLGRNLTRLSYRSTMEMHSRKILTTLASDVRNTKAILNTSIPSNNSLTLTVFNNDPATKMATPTFTVSYAYDTTNHVLTRTTTSTGSPPPTLLDYAIPDVTAPLNETMPSFSFLYFTTTGGSPVSQFNSNFVPMGIKQVAIAFTLQAGDATQTTFSSYPAVSGQLPLINRPLPDGS